MHPVSQKMQLNYIERLHREVSSLVARVPPGTSNLPIEVINNELFVQPFEGPYGRMVKFTNPPGKGTSGASRVRAPQFLQCAVHQEVAWLS